MEAFVNQGENRRRKKQMKKSKPASSECNSNNRDCEKFQKPISDLSNENA